MLANQETNANDGKQIEASEGDPSDPKKERKTIMGIKIKKDTTVWNLIALFMAPMVSVAAGAYVNAQMPYLLQDSSYFDFPFSVTGRRAGEVLFCGYLVATLFTPILGYGYDLIGRFWFMIPTCFLMALQVGLMPLSAPYFW